MPIVLLLFHLPYLILPLSQDLPRHALVCSHSLVRSLTLGKIKMEGALLKILQQAKEAVQCIHPLPFDTSTAGLIQTTLEAYNLNNEHPSSSLMLSTTSLSSITLLLPRYLDLYH